MKSCFLPADILLPDFSSVDGEKWAVIACDQYTGDPAYWKRVEDTVGDAKSTYRMILPEVFLDDLPKREKTIGKTMEEYAKTVLITYRDAMIYVERTLRDGRVLKGVVGKIDLEEYDPKKGSVSLIRATEETVPERVPPRAKIRSLGCLELPHMILLADDKKKICIEPLAEKMKGRKPLYEFDLMENGGRIRGYLLNESEMDELVAHFARLCVGEKPLQFAVGDGNHSLAAAKQIYERLKAEIGEEAAKNHPARYALAEIQNLQDDNLQFEPIYRVVFGCDPKKLIAEFTDYAASLCGNAPSRRFSCLTKNGKTTVVAEHPNSQLAVGVLQNFLNGYSARHPECRVDYIHGAEALETLARRDDAVGFLFEGMKKDELFRTVIADGALPRKTFSMGHAEDKRYYVECRRIKN